MAIIFPRPEGTTKGKRSHNVARLSRGLVFFPKIVNAACTWKLLRQAPPASGTATAGGIGTRTSKKRSRR